MARTKIGILLIFISGFVFSNPAYQGLPGNKLGVFIADWQSMILELKAEVFGKYNFLTNRKDQVTTMQKIPPVTIMKQEIATLEDTIQEDTTVSKKEEISETESEFKNHSFWQKLGFGIGYSGGICYTGKDLMKSSADWDPLAFLDPTNYLYWLNSLEVSFFYPRENGSKIEMELNYGWAHLSDRNGWFKVIYHNNESAYLQGLNSCDIKNIHLSFNRIFTSGFSIGGALIYGESSTLETLTNTSWEVINWSRVVRRNFGMGFAVKYTSMPPKMGKINILPYIAFKISGAYEVWNNSPWNEYWNQKLFLGFSGIYIGLKLCCGGTK